MPPIGKSQKKDWSIEEWLEESIDRRKKLLKRKGRLWDRSLKEDTEIILSSSEESTATEIIPNASSASGQREPIAQTQIHRTKGRLSEQEFAAINEIKAETRGGVRACKFWNSSIGCAGGDKGCPFAHNLCLLCGRDHRWCDRHGQESGATRGHPGEVDQGGAIFPRDGRTYLPRSGKDDQDKQEW